MAHDSRAITYFMLGMAILAGCSPDCWSPKQLAADAARANRVIASDRYFGSKLILSGQEAAGVIRAISSAKGLPKNATATTAPQCQVEFFAETNFLASISLQEEWFADKSGEFIDQSGAIRALQRRLESDETGRKAWIDYLATEVLRTSAFANLQAWSAEALQRSGRGELKLNAHDEIQDWEFQQRIEGAMKTTRLYMPRICICRSQSGDPEALRFDWDQYALLVGPSNFSTSFKASYVTNAAPGIYVYRQ